MAAPPKPWERAGRTSAASAALPVTAASAATVSSTSAVTGGTAGSVSSSLNPSSTSYSSSLGSGYSGSSMYGSSYGGGYGSSMYGGGYGSSMYGGMGSSMYGGGYGSSMYGGMGGRYGSSMYGGGGYGGGMYGQGGNPQESEFFVPKMPQQPDQQVETTGKLDEVHGMNSSFLESLYYYGDGAYRLIRRLLSGLAQLYRAVKEGKVPPAIAQKAAIFAIAVASMCTAAAIRLAIQRQRRRLALEASRTLRYTAVPTAAFGVQAWGRPQAAL
eukprot:TRINITY_DN753_c5_g1_i1.p1 TRINITY_DN753_c5_g1~~TRINITY_DN753_c5_g1_i1.p1  ORF type:complete len:271 (-),score=58.90 TRINITY_DN753_c5_g1_i1:160-972(-)